MKLTYDDNLESTRANPVFKHVTSRPIGVEGYATRTGVFDKWGCNRGQFKQPFYNYLVNYTDYPITCQSAC